MNISQIESNIQELMKTFSKDTFIYDLFAAYDLPKASITRLRNGNLNLSKIDGEICWKKKVFFKEEFEKDLHSLIIRLSESIKHDERFLIVTDYNQLLAIDTKTQDKLDITIFDLTKHYDFFLPWAGMEKAQHANENPADVKAAEKMAKLFDIIKNDNPDDSQESIHGLNLFLSRLLFCYFAEDTHIFEDNQFSNAIDSHTQSDGSDLHTFLDRLFNVLNTPDEERTNLPEYLNAFPYVNGGLFKDFVPSPHFSRSSRAALLSSGDQNWSAINPDIFGSMFQAVIGAEQRGNLGQHYTSVPNIMKVIKPLFLDALYDEYRRVNGSESKAKKLLERIWNIKIFDPACGSGNFLIIAYRELRKLEIQIMKDHRFQLLSNIRLSQFYGIEIDDFAGEIAKLALWLAEHQMNVEFYKEFGRTNPTLPLSEAGHIVQGNACRISWEKICPIQKNDEVYILGNPPYLGSTNQNQLQKEDMKFVFNRIKSYKNLDYISIWFYKGAKYIKGYKSKCAFVSTNSICQGEQVPLLWPNILKQEIEIDFAVKSFKWTNNAKSNAGVVCIIIGLRNIMNDTKYIFDNGIQSKVMNISPYLTDSDNVIVNKRSKPLSCLPQMVYGNKPVDGGNLILSSSQRNEIISAYPFAKEIIRRLQGSKEFVRGEERFCLWIEDNKLDNALSIPQINERINKVRNVRLSSKDEGARKLAEHSHQFRDFKQSSKNSLIIPRVTSDRREYIIVGYLDTDTIIVDSAQAIYDSDPFIFGILSSKIHITWVRAVAGRLKTDYRYSSAICYNTFPFPSISSQRKNEITQSVFRILEEREKHPDKTMAQLYDPDKMPDGLREAHKQNDLIIEKCYRSTPFSSDEERLEYLFKLYEKMIKEEEYA